MAQRAAQDPGGSSRDPLYPYPADGRPLPDPDQLPALGPERIPTDTVEEAGSDAAEADDIGVEPVELPDAVAEIEQDRRRLDPSGEIEPLPPEAVHAELSRRSRQEPRI